MEYATFYFVKIKEVTIYIHQKCVTSKILIIDFEVSKLIFFSQTGLIRTDTEDLFIQPVSQQLPLGQNGRPHFIYSCKNYTLSGNTKDTQSKLRYANKKFRGKF